MNDAKPDRLTFYLAAMRALRPQPGLRHKLLSGMCGDAADKAADTERMRFTTTGACK